jgi:putative methyltransferase (TIGR04325 family)
MLVSQYGDRPVTVLDFGGGACVGLRCIRGMVGDLPNLRYVLVETPTLCRALDGLADGTHILIQTEMPTNIGAPLIISASGSLQYIPEYADTFNRMLDLHPDALVLSLTSMSDAPTYARQQCNIPRVRLGAWVFEKSELLGLAAKRNYRCTFCVDHDVGATHVDAPSPPRFSSMIFRPQ